MAGAPVTDPALLAQLNGLDASAAPPPPPAAASSSRQAVTDPALLSQLEAPDQPNVDADILKSGASGIVKGALGAAFSPATLPSAAAGGITSGGDWLVRHALGMGPPSADWQAKQQRAQQEGGFGIPGPDAVANFVLGKVSSMLPTPQTTAGKYAEAIGEFAPGAAIGPGGAVRKALADVVVPAVASEAAGEAAQGSAYEAAARTGAALLGNAGSAAGRLYTTAPDRMVRHAAEGVTPQQFTDAQALQQTGARIGVPLTGPEAVQQTTAGASRLDNSQRLVETSQGGGAPMAQFMAQRPDQVRAATGNALDAIGPAATNPSTLGPQAADMAGSAIDTVRQGINAATQPAYSAAGQHVLDSADFAPIARDPAFQVSLQRLRNDPVLGPQYANQPDASVNVIDAVTKDMQAQGQAQANVANPGFQPQRAAMYSSGAADARDIARDPARGGTQAYDDALTMQQQARAQNLSPLEQGPLGGVASAGDTQSAYGALLPQKPLAGGASQVGDAVTRLAQQDPVIAAALVRQSLADAGNSTMARNLGGDNQWGGAKFAQQVAGTDQQRSNLSAALGALPTGQAAQQAILGDLLPVLEATGKRRSFGSNTQADTQAAREISELPGVTKLADPLHAVSDAAQRLLLNRRTTGLADLFTAPDSASRIAQIVAAGHEAPVLAAIGRTGLANTGVDGSSSRPAIPQVFVAR